MPIETVALTYIKMAQWVSLRCGKPKPPMRRSHRSPCNLFSAIKSPRNLSLCCSPQHKQWGSRKIETFESVTMGPHTQPRLPRPARPLQLRAMTSQRRLAFGAIAQFEK